MEETVAGASAAAACGHGAHLRPQPGPRRVLFLSGWTPGPLLELEGALQRRGHPVEWVPLPMPPVGLAWLWNPYLAAILLIVGAAVKAAEAVVAHAGSAGVTLCLGATVLVSVMVLLRLAVAGLVRTAVAQGVARTRARLGGGGSNGVTGGSGEVGLIVGFSWGGAVVHWLLAEATPAGAGGGGCAELPPTLLLAPPVLTISSICRLGAPPALHAPPRGPRGGSGAKGDGGGAAAVAAPAVAAVVAVDDGFCPHPATARMYETEGCDVVVASDNHVLLRRASVAAVVRAATQLLAGGGDGDGVWGGGSDGGSTDM